MTDPKPLFLHEELLLLALRDEEGTISAAMYPYALAGAILAELMLHERIRVEDPKKKMVHPLGDSPLGDALLDECLQKIAKAERPDSLSDWVERFTAVRHLKDRVAEGLCERGILRAEKGTFLFVFPKVTYPEVDHGPEGKILQRLQSAVFSEAEDIDTRTAVLLSLASSTGMLPTIFDPKDLKPRQEHIDRITQGEQVGQAAKEAIDAMQAALAMMTINTTLIS
jgi:Golgi phosphoprotein 3